MAEAAYASAKELVHGPAGLVQNGSLNWPFSENELGATLETIHRFAASQGRGNGCFLP